MAIPVFDIVILAAGKGTRMRSALPKVMHAVAGRPLLGHVIERAKSLQPRAVHVVYGHGGEAVKAAFAGEPIHWVLQAEQHGTGHALKQAMPAVAGPAVLVLYGDVPLTRLETLAPLIEAATRGQFGLLTQTLDNPDGYGRILRDAGRRVTRIVEHKDASESERAVREINTGILAAPSARMRGWLDGLSNNNVQGEYYLTDTIAMAVADGLTIETAQPRDSWEVLGVNSKRELAVLERHAQREAAERLMDQGVTLLDPARFDVRGTVEAGRDVTIDVNVVCEGRVVLGDNVRIGPNVVLRDCRIGAGTIIHPHCVIEDAEIGTDCRIGPFARLRPEARIGDTAHIGNFVEIKKSEIGQGSKVNHLAYVGDATVGSGVNVGAGAITANYDGANKHHTDIGNHASIGSNCVLVAPVKIGDGATIGAGSVISKDAPANELTVARAKAMTVPGWKRPTKK